MNILDIKEIQPLKYADNLIDNIYNKGLIEMIMNKTFTFFILQDGTLKYYNSNGTFGEFDEIGEGRTFYIFNEKTNIIIRGDCTGKIFFDMYKEEENKWISAIDTFFVENNNKLSFHDPELSKMYFFVGENILQIYSYSVVLLNENSEKTDKIKEAKNFAILVQNIEDIQLKGNPSNVIMSKYGLFIIQREIIEFYKFNTNELLEIQITPEIFKTKDFRIIQYYIHPQTSDLIMISEKGEVYLIDSKSNLLIPIKIGEIEIPKENYKIHFYYRFLIILTDYKMYIYNMRKMKNPIIINTIKNYEVISIVSWNNPDVSIGFYSNSLKSFNEYLFNEKMKYSNDMKEGMLYFLLNDFKNTLIGIQYLNSQLITKFLDRLGNDLPLIIFLSTKVEYREYAINRFKEKYKHEYLINMANGWNPKDIEIYFTKLQEIIKPEKHILLNNLIKKEWEPKKFNLADITVQLSNNPTEEKINKVYSLLGITNKNQVIYIPDELIISITQHQTNWFRPLIIPLLKLRPYELLQHMIIITDDLPQIDIIIIFQQVFTPINLYYQKNQFNKDQQIVYAIFITIISSFNKALENINDELIPIFLERLVAFPLDKLTINYKLLCSQALHKSLIKGNMELAEIIFKIIWRKYTPSTIENILEDILQQELYEKQITTEVQQWIIKKISLN
ncbi:hypothetical protein EDI_044580 [Entamoeba dispar SAW760]|uniref:Uncharacterized protein n=1 Tax=Entamoeba dispar (strain ATCC PRA-260 / SAW760) TaxID=370354 RepID=B0EHV8_ENTDS|nr:uncharacterized protein EDI_044580 [Entamoeba dispar SAW760]EDR25902.1 hypothetical protein EDI_044580 [Entamoeba dispar SAW760]|eukprot:EDR25902.1 hypothetical protein EDI_044580 [Entamoeba dispar SAW760]